MGHLFPKLVKLSRGCAHLCLFVHRLRPSCPHDGRDFLKNGTDLALKSRGGAKKSGMTQVSLFSRAIQENVLLFQTHKRENYRA